MVILDGFCLVNLHGILLLQVMEAFADNNLNPDMRRLHPVVAQVLPHNQIYYKLLFELAVLRCLGRRLVEVPGRKMLSLLVPELKMSWTSKGIS